MLRAGGPLLCGEGRLLVPAHRYSERMGNSKALYSPVGVVEGDQSSSDGQGRGKTTPRTTVLIARKPGDVGGRGASRLRAYGELARRHAAGMILWMRRLFSGPFKGLWIFHPQQMGRGQSGLVRVLAFQGCKRDHGLLIRLGLQNFKCAVRLQRANRCTHFIVLDEDKSTVLWVEQAEDRFSITMGDMATIGGMARPSSQTPGPTFRGCPNGGQGSTESLRAQSASSAWRRKIRGEWLPRLGSPVRALAPATLFVGNEPPSVGID